MGCGCAKRRAVIKSAVRAIPAHIQRNIKKINELKKKYLNGGEHGQ